MLQSQPEPDVPFCIIKKLLYIRETDYFYHIDEDGYGLATIDDHHIEFYINQYGEVCTDTIRYETNKTKPTNDKKFVKWQP